MEKKREILEEKIKQALTSTYKVISDQLRYKKPNAKTTDIKSLDFSEIKDLKNKDDYVKLRASTDSKALKLRFSDSIIFFKNHPRNPALKKIYQLSEVMRCEMLGSKMLNGIKKNLENYYYQKIRDKNYKEVNTKEESNLADAFELYLLEKFYKFKLNKFSLKTLSYWRKDFDKNFNSDLDYLLKNIENQDRYNSRISKLLEKMDIFEDTQDQMNNQNQDNQNSTNNESKDKDNNQENNEESGNEEGQIDVKNTDFLINNTDFL